MFITQPYTSVDRSLARATHGGPQIVDAGDIGDCVEGVDVVDKRTGGVLLPSRHGVGHAQPRVVTVFRDHAVAVGGRQDLRRRRVVDTPDDRSHSGVPNSLDETTPVVLVLQAVAVGVGDLDQTVDAVVAHRRFVGNERAA